MKACPQCDKPLRLIATVNLEGEFVDIHNEEGELVGEDIKIRSKDCRKRWVCNKCGGRWHA